MPADAECWCFETTTGVVREVLPVTALSWNTPLDSSGKVEATIALDDRSLTELNVRDLTMPWRRSLAVVRGGREALAAGVINPDRSWDTDNPGQVKVSAPDIWAVLARRYLLGSYQPGALTDLTLTAATLPGLATEIVNRAVNDVPGGALPIELPDREPGDTHTRTWKGTDLTDAKKALEDLSAVEGGPDVVFDPVLSADRSHITWQMRVGRPRLGLASSSIVFDYPSRWVAKTGLDEDASGQATVMLVTAQPQSTDTSGEGTGEQVNLVARADNPSLLDLGFPALWGHNGDHTDVNQQQTLDGYAAAYAKDAFAPTTELPLTVRVDHPDHPYGTYQRGDVITEQIGDGHPWIPGSKYTLRIVDIAADLTDNVVLTTSTDAGDT